MPNLTSLAFQRRCRVCEKSASRGATVEGGEEKTVECSDELTTISTVAPRLENHSPTQPALKRRPKLNRRSATKNKSVARAGLRGMGGWTPKACSVPGRRRRGACVQAPGQEGYGSF